MQRWMRAVLAAGLAAALCSACKNDTDELAAAQTALARKDNGAARIHLMSAIQRDPQSAQARYLLGSLMLELGDAPSAVIELDKAQSLGHPAEQTIPALARALVMQGDYRKVLGLGAEAAGLPNAALADLQTSVATAQFALRNNVAGEAALTEALRLAPGHVPARVLKTHRMAAAGDVDAALRYALETVQRFPADARAWLARADLLSGLPGSVDEAVAAYRKVLELHGNAIRAHSGVLTLLLARKDTAAAAQQLELLSKDEPQHPATLYFGAQLALLRGDTAAAREGADKLLAISPMEPTYNRLAATVSLETGELAKAVSQLTGAVQANPSDRSLRRLLTLALVRSGDGRQALATVRPLLQEKRPDAEAIALAAVASLQAGDAAQARSYFATAAALAPADPHVRAALAMGRLAAGEGSTALSELQSLARADGGSTVDTVLISAYVQRKEFDRALRAIEALEQKLPKDPAGPVLRGDLALRRGDAAAARASYERAASLSPTYFPATGALARLDLADGQPAKARERFQALLKRDPRNTDALVALAKLNRMTGAPAKETSDLLAEAVRADPQQPGIRLLQIEHELSQGNASAALTAADAATRAMPDDARLVSAQAQACIAAREYDQALAILGKLTATRPDAVEPLQQLARVQLALHRPDQARQALQQAARLAPKSADVQADLARFEISAGKPAEAQQIARRLQQQQPSNALGWLLEGEAAASSASWASAEAAYNTAIAKPGGAAKAAIGLHAVLSKAGKSQQADAFAARWLRERPKDAEFAQYLGDQALLAQDYGRAESLYQAVLRLRPDSAVTLNNLAWAAHNLGRPGALGFAERAAQLRPMEPAFLDTLAQLLEKANQLDQALQREARAVELAPDSPGYRVVLARLYARTGDKARARAELDRLTSLGKRFGGQAQVDEVRKLL